MARTTPLAATATVLVVIAAIGAALYGPEAAREVPRPAQAAPEPKEAPEDVSPAAYEPPARIPATAPRGASEPETRSERPSEPPTPTEEETHGRPTRAEAAGALAGKLAGDVAPALSECFRRDHPDLMARILAADPSESLAAIFGDPGEIEWPALDNLTSEVLAWFDDEDRVARRCPVVMMEARFSMERGEEALHDELTYELPWWFTEPERIDALVWADYDRDEWVGDLHVFAALLEERSRWEDRAHAAHEQALAWLALTRELAVEFDTPSTTWMHETFDDPCVPNR